MKEVNYDNGQTEFELFIVDSDTALFTAAKQVQEDYVTVKNKLTGVTWEFSEFRLKTIVLGTKRTGEMGGWVKAICDFTGASLSRDDIEITQHTRLRLDIEDHLAEAERYFAYEVSRFKNNGYTKDYRLCLGGEGNFRYGAATILPYKGERKEKPIIFAELKEKVFAQYKSKVIIANDCESDDTLGIYGAKNQAHFRKTGQYKYLLGYIDKDIKQIWSPTLFLSSMDAPIKFITPFEAAHHFAFQMIKGDLTVDNIQGLPDLSPETKERYGLRKVKGCGEVAATTILSSCVTIKELFERVLEVYKAYYKDDWMLPLKENAILLWMQRTPNQRFDIVEDLLTKLEIKYDYQENHI